MSERGLLFILSGPSGVGKGTVRKALFESEGTELKYSVSMTTRQMRQGEQEGVDYFFRTREEFEEKIAAGEMLEYAEYVGNYYGTPLDYVNKTLDEGYDVFLEIEVLGAMKVKEKVPEGIFIFLTPPDLAELKSRIVNRGTDEMAVIDKRMSVAREEIEMMSHYDYAVVNDQVDKAVERIKHIIESEHCRVDRVVERYKNMLKEL
ncbi:guanylate kinase [Vagococcus lutrae]|uniref:guanylate kinase n=1 Tax=Vagococcus lutrae TaxID=81947 RepID=UPI001C941AA6|nr:guanylate kinase [Vagococcus lutrae]MDT2801317.1 guanylate kinase [Vagococcus lutrae]MDT2805735.1 guanylate kinase [Vagococcus lutrae]MDT2823930.1 guanylate kinase [Vagococcus lutrae]MDT2825485.1 guanylate kinase [Vagococcus lutrae]MDT2841464.1 guanylate kinase [Vagococcus lutrae]